MAEVIKDSIQTFFKKLSNGIMAIPSKVNHYVHTNPKQISYGMVLVSVVGLGLLYVEQSDKDSEESVEESVEELESAGDAKEESPIQGGSRRRKNQSKKTKRQKR